MRRLCQWIVTLFVLASVSAGCSDSSPAPEATAPPPAQQNATIANATAIVPLQQSPGDPTIDGLVTQLMVDYDIPGAGVALVQDGAVRYVQGYGVRSTATGAPVTPGTLFAIGSVTKSFTALGVLQLVDQGRVGLDSPVTTYVPTFTLANPAAAQQITVRQLLAQTSGLPGGDDNAWYSGQITTLEGAVAYAAGLILAAAPGTTHIYDNYNYAIAGYLIEQLTGQPWADAIRDQILTPLDISSATADIHSMQQAQDHAVPHTLDILDGMQPRDFVSLAGIASAGSLNVSAQGMAQYLQFQLSDGTVNGVPLLSPALLDAMHSQQIAYPPQPPVGPTGFQTRGYALGWFVADFNGRTVLWHNGSIDGFYSIALFIPAENIGVAVLSNAGLGTGSLFTLGTGLALLEAGMNVEPGRDVVAALNQEAAYDPVSRRAALDAARSYDADPASWPVLLGTYSGAGGTFRIEQRDTALVLIPAQGAQRTLIPSGPSNFVVANRSRDGLITEYSVVTGANGQLTLLRDGVVLGVKSGA